MTDHAACVKVIECHSDSVDLEIGGQEVTCSFDGGNVEIPGFDGVLNCPSSNILCQAMPCMNHCSGLGVCKNGVCECDNGSNEPDCGGGDIDSDVQDAGGPIAGTEETDFALLLAVAIVGFV